MALTKDQSGGRVSKTSNIEWCSGVSRTVTPMTPMAFRQYLNEQFINTMKHSQIVTALINASTVIRAKLHKSEKSDLDIEEASKNTRRNAQYSSMALNQLWYFAYQAVYGEEPPLIKGISTLPRLIDEKGEVFELTRQELMHYSRFTADQAIRFTSNPRKFKIINLNQLKPNEKHIRLVTIEVDIVDNQKKQSYKQYNNKDWTYEMAKFIETNMHIVVEYAFAKYRHYGSEYDRFSREISKYENDLKRGPSESQMALMKATINHLKEEQKIPSILSKLNAALLMECDLEIFLNMWIEKRIAPCDYKDYDTRLINNLINELTTMRYCKDKAILKATEFRANVKCANYANVLEMLREIAIVVKYRKYDIVDMGSQSFLMHNIKDFATLSCHTECIEYFVCVSQLNPQQHTNENATFIHVTDKGEQYIYDVLNLPNKSTSVLEQLSWSDRLHEAEKYVNSVGNYQNKYGKINFVKVHYITELDIRFNRLPEELRGCRNKTFYMYFSTRGFGRATNFVKVVSADGKCKNPTPNPRQKRPRSPSQIIGATNRFSRKYQYTEKLLTLRESLRMHIDLRNKALTDNTNNHNNAHNLSGTLYGGLPGGVGNNGFGNNNGSSSSGNLHNALTNTNNDNMMSNMNCGNGNGSGSGGMVVVSNMNVMQNNGANIAASYYTTSHQDAVAAAAAQQQQQLNYQQQHNNHHVALNCNNNQQHQQQLVTSTQCQQQQPLYSSNGLIIPLSVVSSNLIETASTGGVGGGGVVVGSGTAVNGSLGNGNSSGNGDASTINIDDDDDDYTLMPPRKKQMLVKMNDIGGKVDSDINSSLISSVISSTPYTVINEALIEDEEDSDIEESLIATIPTCKTERVEDLSSMSTFAPVLMKNNQHYAKITAAARLAASNVHNNNNINSNTGSTGLPTSDNLNDIILGKSFN